MFAPELTRTAFGQGVDGGLVRIWVGFALLGKLIERHVESVVGLGDVLLQMLAYAG